jgi:hypothetical protein
MEIKILSIAGIVTLMKVQGQNGEIKISIEQCVLMTKFRSETRRRTEKGLRVRCQWPTSLPVVSNCACVVLLT